jgi:DNA-directed RNA polymerase subunit L
MDKSLLNINIDRAAELSHPIFGTELRLVFHGTGIDSVLVNTLRQVVYSEIPVYAISRSSIVIDKNSSTNDDNIMRQRLSMIPIFKVNTQIDFLERTYYPYVNNMTEKIYPDKEYPKHPKDDININLFGDIKNNGDNINEYDETDIKYVTTNDIKITNNGQEVKNAYDKKIPLLIINLKPGQEFAFNAKAVLGIAKLHSCWDAVSQCTYFQIDETSYGFVIKSLGQRTEWDCLKVACDIINKKVSRLKEFVKKEYSKNSADKPLTIIVQNESHMLGNLMKSFLDKHSNIVKSAYKIDHPFVSEVTIYMEVKSGIKQIDVFNEVCDFIVDTFNIVKKKLEHAEQVKYKENEIIIELREKKKN